MTDSSSNSAKQVVGAIVGAQTLAIDDSPEGAAANVATKVVVGHAGTILMFPFVWISIILIIIGIIAFSAASNKVPGVMITIVGLLLGGGAFFMMYKDQSKPKAA